MSRLWFFLAFALVAGSSYGFLLAPVQDRIAELEQEETILRKDFERWQQLAVNAWAYQMQVDELERVQESLGRFTAPLDERGIRLYLEGMASAAQLELLEFEASPEVRREFYLGRDVRLRVRGAFPDLVNQLAFAEGRRFRVSTIRLARDANGTVSADLQLLWYQVLP